MSRFLLPLHNPKDPGRDAPVILELRREPGTSPLPDEVPAPETLLRLEAVRGVDVRVREAVQALAARESAACLVVRGGRGEGFHGIGPGEAPHGSLAFWRLTLAEIERTHGLRPDTASRAAFLDQYPPLPSGRATARPRAEDHPTPRAGEGEAADVPELDPPTPIPPPVGPTPASTPAHGRLPAVTLPGGQGECATRSEGATLPGPTPPTPIRPDLSGVLAVLQAVERPSGHPVWQGRGDDAPSVAEPEFDAEELAAALREDPEFCRWAGRLKAVLEDPSRTSDTLEGLHALYELARLRQERSG
ncbi:MAG: hypothetical protein FJX77_06715 [Armatimonadetes bacterium]|nr:hypothetical protein [Armatimonadota bacterium]